MSIAILSSQFVASATIAFPDFFARHGAKIFPIRKDTKKPMFAGWQKAATSDPELLALWPRQFPGCAWAVACAESGWMCVEIDVKARRTKEKDSEQAGTDRAWQAWQTLCAEWSIRADEPHVFSRSGGWHFFFKPPLGVDVRELVQRGLVKLPNWYQHVIETRINGFVLIPPSTFDGRAYSWNPKAPADLYAAPAGLIDASAKRHALPDTPATLVKVKRHALPDTQPDAPATLVKPGSYDLRAFAKYVCKVHHQVGMPRDVWRAVIFAMVAQYGRYVAFQIAHAIHDSERDTTDQIDDLIGRARETFVEGDSTLQTLFKHAHDNGIRDSVPRSTASMFGFPAAPLDIDVILAEIDKECTVVTDSPPIAPGIPSPQEAAEPTGIRPRRIDAASLDGKPVPDREWLVRDLIPAKNVTLLYGDGGTGKSLLALQLGAAVVTGRPFFAHIVKQGRVEFVTAEDSLDEMHRRLVDIAPLGSLSGFHLTSLAETDAMLAVAPDSRGGALAVTALYNELESVIAESRPVLVVLDTLADVFGGNEIIRAQARQFIGMLRRLCLRYDCTIVVLAHPSLAGMEKGTSGSTGWNNSVRSRLYFGRVHDGSDGSESDEDARVLRLGKSNYGRVGLEIPMRWRAGVFVSEGGAASGDPLVTAGKAERVFLELLDKANDRNSHVSGSLKANNYAPKVFARDALKQRVRKGDLIDAMDRLITSKRIENAPYGSPSRMHYRLQRIYVPAQPAPPL